MSNSYNELALLVDVDPDGVDAALKIVQADTDNSFVTVQGAKKALMDAKVTFGIDFDTIEMLCEKLDDYEAGQHVIVAKSTPPVHGKDGDIEFAVNVSGQASYEAASNNGTIDFKSATSVVSVKPGELLATHIPPQPGTPGTNVHGSTLPPRAPKDFVVRASQNVEYREETHTFHALAHGRPVYADGGLSVLPVYEVGGDVDYSTGHIKFAGSVIVNGSVQDDFNITAKDILVKGSVGACELTADNNITIKGGVNAREKGMIKAGGELVAKYLNATNIECLGDIIVMREIVHSKVLCNGSIRTGSLIGGLTVARKGLEVNILGSDLGVATRVEPGSDIALRKIESALDNIDEKLDQVLKPVQIFFGNRAKYKALPDDKKEEFKMLFEAFCRLKEAHIKLAEKRAQIMNNSTEHPNKEVTVLKMLHPDTIIATELCMKNFTKPATGPLVVVEDIDRSTMSLKPYGDRKKLPDS
jgi:uncharacterized protein (DUF342 family)